MFENLERCGSVATASSEETPTEGRGSLIALQLQKLHASIQENSTSNEIIFAAGA